MHFSKVSSTCKSILFTITYTICVQTFFHPLQTLLDIFRSCYLVKVLLIQKRNCEICFLKLPLLSSLANIAFCKSTAEVYFFRRFAIVVIVPIFFRSSCLKVGKNQSILERVWANFCVFFLFFIPLHTDRCLKSYSNVIYSLLFSIKCHKIINQHLTR